MSAQFVPLDASWGPPIPVQQPVLLVGRHPEVDVRLNSPMVSRRHCCLAVVYDRVVIRDLGSRHGVFVNGVRVDEAEVRPGDEVAIAHFIYRYEVTRPAAANAPAPLGFPAPSLEIAADELIPLDD